MSLRFLINKINLNELIEIHLLCDKDFVPALSSRVSIPDYCKKLHTHADIISLIHKNKTIGLVAVYANNKKERTAYISSVCMLKEFRGKGYSRLLLENAIVYVKLKELNYIHLEVGLENVPAISLYESLGFIQIKKDLVTQIMELVINKRY